MTNAKDVIKSNLVETKGKKWYNQDEKNKRQGEAIVMKNLDVDIKKMTEKEKDEYIVALQNDYAALQNANKSLVSDYAALEQEVTLLKEQIKIMRERVFGAKTEKGSTMSPEQISFEMNEAEGIADTSEDTEPDSETITYTRKKQVGKREKDLEGLPVEVVNNTLSEEELAKEFPDEEYTRLPDSVYKKLEMIPAKFYVRETHIAVYKGKKSGKIVRANREIEMIDNSVATPSLVAALINAKYVNAMPLYRQEQMYKDFGMNISRQNMAHWIIKVGKEYIEPIYTELHKRLKYETVIQADETPVKISKDGRIGSNKSYIWVYRTTEYKKEKPIVLYDCSLTRGTKNPLEYLDGFKGTIECDGFSVYETLENNVEGISVANCWAHARRPFAEVVKSLEASGKKRGTTAKKAIELIAKIYKVDNELKELSAEERYNRRQKEVKSLVEVYFAWLKEIEQSLPAGSAISKAVQYSLNRETGLKKFLEDGNIPIDNSSSERSIKPVVIGRKNWIMIDTVSGAKVSAMIYSLVETAKANGLNTYEYLRFLLSEMPKHIYDKDKSYVHDLLPWSDKLPIEVKRNDE